MSNNDTENGDTEFDLKELDELEFGKTSKMEWVMWKVMGPFRWYQQAEFITWRRLATFGNNPLVKLTILAPLLAQVLIHRDTIAFLAHYDFKNIGYLYTSLMCFSVAQLIYTFRCHRDIKDYPSEVKFAQALNATESDQELNREFFEVYKRYFTKYGGNIEVENYVSFDLFRRAAKEKMRAHRKAVVGETETETETETSDVMSTAVAGELYRVFESVFVGKQLDPIDWKLILDVDPEVIVSYIGMKRKEDGELSYKDEEYALRHLLSVAKKEFRSSHWRAETLKRRYDKLNNSNLLARLIAATLYGFGSIYFIYTSVSNVCRVLNTYGWLDHINLFLPECRIFCQ